MTQHDSTTAIHALDESAISRSRMHPILRRSLLVGLVAIAAIFVAQVLWQSRDAFANYVGTSSLWLALAAVAFATTSVIWQGLLNALLVSQLDPSPFKLGNLLSGFFISRVVRYVPGKVWGIYFQSERLASEVSRKSVWIANLVQLIYSNASTVLVALGALVALRIGEPWSLAALVALTAVAIWGLQIRLPFKTANAIGRMLGKPVATMPADAQPRTFRVALLISLDWLGYFAFWMAMASPFMTVSEAALLAIAYAAASLVGILAFVLPSGLIVREATFVYLAVGLGFDATEATVLSIVARVFLTLGDLIVPLLFTVVRRRARTT